MRSKTLKKVLVVSYYWPPSGKASLHLPLKLVKHLPSFGWQPVVLTVKEDGFSERDESLLGETDPALPVYRTDVLEPFEIYRLFTGKKKGERLVASETISKENRSLSHRISVWIRMNLFVPDARVGWYWHAKKEIYKIIEEHQISAIVVVAPPHSSHLAPWRISREKGIPFIPLFIDPWVDIVYYRGMKRGALTLMLDNYLEERVLTDSAAAIFVTASMKEDYIRKYPSIAAKSSVLYWGYNEENFTGLTAFSKGTGEPVTVLHSGNIFDFQNIPPFWQYIQKSISAGARIRLRFTGSVSPGIRSAISEHGLDAVTEYTGFLPYGEVITEMSRADFLLVCATEKRHLPGKLFEYIRCGRPVIAFGDDNQEVEAILRETGAGKLFGYTETGRDYFAEVAGMSPDMHQVSKYDRKQAAGQLGEILNKITGH